MRDWGMMTRRQVAVRMGTLLLGAAALAGAGPAAAADKIKVAGIYTQPIQQKGLSPILRCYQI